MTSRLYDLSRGVLDCVCSALGSDCPPSRKSLAPGAPEGLAWESCCDGGQLTVQLATSYPSTQFPNVDTAPSICELPYIAHVLSVTLLRCTPVGSANAGPTPDQLQAAAQRQFADIEAVMAGLVCCMNDKDAWSQLLGSGYKWVLGQAVSVGPDGGCAGFVQQLTVGLPTCFDCCGS